MCEATIKQLIYDTLSHADSKGMTITDIRNSNPLLATLSIQKITYILNIAPFLCVNNICYGIYWYKKAGKAFYSIDTKPWEGWGRGNLHPKK
jgi:hypothetical protein